MSHANLPPFPHIETAEGPAVVPREWLAQNHQRLFKQVEQTGAVLLRGFALGTDQDFDAAIDEFHCEAFTYAGSLSNAVRTNRTAKVFTANEAPASVEIFLHHEMAQTPRYPSKLFFFCELAPDAGGATPLCRSDLLLAAMKQHMPHFVEQCRRAGLRYTNVMPAEADHQSGQGRSWKSTLSCETPAQAEARLTELGYTWQWQEDNSLRVTTPVLPAIRTLPSGVEVFFNQLIAAYQGWKDPRNAKEKTVRFGDDSDIADQDMQQVVALAADFTVDLQWQVGDLAIVDNFLVMHGRRPFEGRRIVLASLVA